MARAVIKGVCEAGANVFDIGLSGTEEMYCAVSELSADAGIVVTASHNPIEYNGMKIVKDGSQPLSEKDFLGIKSLAEKNTFESCCQKGSIFDQKISARDTYLKKILKFVDIKSLKDLKKLLTLKWNSRASN